MAGPFPRVQRKIDTLATPPLSEPTSHVDRVTLAGIGDVRSRALPTQLVDWLWLTEPPAWPTSVKIALIEKIQAG